MSYKPHFFETEPERDGERRFAFENDGRRIGGCVVELNVSGHLLTIKDFEVFASGNPDSDALYDFFARGALNTCLNCGGFDVCVEYGENITAEQGESANSDIWARYGMKISRGRYFAKSSDIVFPSECGAE